jgi:uncharacterized membrane protein YiaA
MCVGSEGVWWSGDKGMSWKSLTEKGYYTVVMEDGGFGRSQYHRFVLNQVKIDEQHFLVMAAIKKQINGKRFCN